MADMGNKYSAARPSNVPSYSLDSIPFIRASAAQQVWHYTNAEGLRSIVADNSLWASSTLALNDAAEVEYGKEVLQEAWRAYSIGHGASEGSTQVEEMLHSEEVDDNLAVDFFIVSASKLGDSLSQWRGYAGSQGYAIAFDTRQELRQRHAPTARTESADSTPTFRRTAPHRSAWYDVEYVRIQQLEMARATIEFAVNTLNDKVNLGHLGRLNRLIASMAFAILTPCFKDPAFADEREVRYVHALQPETAELFRVGPRGLVPYVCLEPKRSSTTQDGPPEPLAILGVCCGPNGTGGPNPPVEAAVRRLLKHDHSGAGVSTSPIRFRP